MNLEERRLKQEHRIATTRQSIRKLRPSNGGFLGGSSFGGSSFGGQQSSHFSGGGLLGGGITDNIFGSPKPVQSNTVRRTVKRKKNVKRTKRKSKVKTKRRRRK